MVKLIRLAAWIDEHILRHRFDWICNRIWDAELKYDPPDIVVWGVLDTHEPYE